MSTCCFKTLPDLGAKKKLYLSFNGLHILVTCPTSHNSRLIWNSIGMSQFHRSAFPVPTLVVMLSVVEENLKYWAYGLNIWHRADSERLSERDGVIQSGWRQGSLDRGRWRRWKRRWKRRRTPFNTHTGLYAGEFHTFDRLSISF